MLVGLEVVIGRAAHEVLAVRVIMAGNEEAAAGAARKTSRLTYHSVIGSPTNAVSSIDAFLV